MMDCPDGNCPMPGNQAVKGGAAQGSAEWVRGNKKVPDTSVAAGGGGGHGVVQVPNAK